MLKLIVQLCRFGVVGLTAATIHFSIVVFLVQHFLYLPLIANAIAFMFSFQVSYWGHRTFTFNESDVLHRIAIPRLLLIQVFNFFANETLFFIFLSMHIPYQLALLMVLGILPVFTFAASKIWVFR